MSFLPESAESFPQETSVLKSVTEGVINLHLLP